MPKKSKRVRGQKVSLSDLMGPQARRDNLPSAPSGNVDPGRGGYRRGGGGRERTEGEWTRGRGGGGGGRESYQPSRADQSNSWRQVGSQSGSSAVFGPRGGGYQPRAGLSTSNRFDNSGPWRGGTQDARHDTRPAHLRNRFSRGASDRNQQLQAQKKVQEADKEEHLRKLAEKKAKDQAKKDADRKSVHAKRATSYASNLRGPAIRWANKQSPLEIAVEDSTGIKGEDLEESFKRLNFRKSPAEDAARILSNGLIDSKFTCEEIIQSLQGNCSSQAKTSKMAVATFRCLHSRGPTRYHRVMDGADAKSLMDVVNPSDLEGKALDAFLIEKAIFFLKPVPDISEEVHAELKNGSSADAVLRLIDSKIDSKQSPTNLIPIVMGHVLSHVFESKDGLQLDIIHSFAPILIRCQEGRTLDEEGLVRGGVASQVAILFAVQRAWCRDGKDTNRILGIFQKLYEDAVVFYESLAVWRDDRSPINHEGKSDALFGVADWITEVKPIEPEESDEEEEDEEGGDEDEFANL